MAINIENLEADPPLSTLMPRAPAASELTSGTYATAANWRLDMATRTPKPLTAPEKAFWKDAFLACAQSGKRLAPDQATVGLCADFADAAMDAYRARAVNWRRP